MRTEKIYSSNENHPGYGAGMVTLRDMNTNVPAAREK